jgi:hypothetical protein
MNTEGDDVTLSLVYPYKEARDYLNGLTKDVAWVYLTYTDQRGRENFHVQDFELPTDENILHINTSATSLNDCLKLIDNYVRNHKS